MRVGLLTTSFPLPGNPVSGIFVARLAERLSKEIRLTVLTPCGVSPPPVTTEADYDLRCFKYALRRWQLIAHQPGGIPESLQRRRWLILLLPAFVIGMFLGCWRLTKRVDLLHANWTAVGAIAGIVGALTSTPVITTLRGSDVARLQRSRFERVLLRICMRTNARVVCVSEAIAEQTKERVPDLSSKLVVVPNGVDETFLDIRRAPYSPDSRPLSLVTVGNLTENKATHFAIEALGLIADDSTAELTIVGDGPERSALEFLVKSRGLIERVRFRGQLPPDLIPEMLERADILLLTSRTEGRPNVVLEAMAAELPVVASRIPGVVELVQDDTTGLLFEPANVTALAECILRLERDPVLRSRLGKAARSFIRERGLTWSRTAGAYLDIYRTAGQISEH